MNINYRYIYGRFCDELDACVTDAEFAVVARKFRRHSRIIEQEIDADRRRLLRLEEWESEKRIRNTG